MKLRPQDGEPWGELTLKRHKDLVEHGIHLHVFLNGVEVTKRCYFADDTPGRQHVILYKLNERNSFFVEAGEHHLASEICYGKVEFKIGEPFICE